MASIFPFNHLDDDDFELALYELAHGSLNYDFDRLATLHFNPLFGNSSSDLFQDLDPDTNFYRTTGCNYYLADQFTESFGSDIATDKSLFSVMHLNIRSLPRNLEKLSDYLLGISAKFSLIGLSETWLSADSGFVEDVMPNLKGAKYFSKLDANSDYWQIKLDKAQSSQLSTLHKVNTTLQECHFAFKRKESKDESRQSHTEINRN